MTLAGRAVVITGVTSGIGRAATMALAELGAVLCLVGRNPDLLGLTCQRARELGGTRQRKLQISRISLK